MVNFLLFLFRLSGKMLLLAFSVLALLGESDESNTTEDSDVSGFTGFTGFTGFGMSDE